jgi:hypothetical protein
MRRNAFFCFALLALATPALAGDLVVTEITVDPSPALPGEPVWVTLSIQNKGAKALPVPLAGILEAVPEGGGEPVALRSWDTVVVPLSVYEEFRPSVPAGGTIRLDVTSGKVADGFLFQEPRLWKPGRHALRVLLFEGFGWPGAGASLGHVPWQELYANGNLTVPPIISPDAVLHVRTPTGRDAEAWAEFMRRTEGAGFNQGTEEQRAELAYEIATNFPDSAYAPYFALWTPAKFRKEGGREAIARLYREIMERHPDSPATEYHRNRAPFAKAYDARDRAPDVQTALRMLDEATAGVAQRIKTTPRTLTRLQLEKEARALPTRAMIERAFEMRREKAAAQKR